jgi:hypothetical protein
MRIRRAGSESDVNGDSAVDPLVNVRSRPSFGALVCGILRCKVMTS